MNLKPRGIREHLDLNKPIYRPHLRLWPFWERADADGGFSWEKTDLAEQLKARLVPCSLHRLPPRAIALAGGDVR